MSLRKSVSSGDLYSAFEEAEDCFQAIERSIDSSLHSYQERRGSSRSLTSLESSVSSLCSFGSGEAKADRKAGRRKSKNRADQVRQQLAITQDVKRNLRGFRRNNSEVDLHGQDNEEIKKDAAMVEESLRAMEQLVMRASQELMTKKTPRRRRSTGNLFA
jgi:hypothetical protein